MKKVIFLIYFLSFSSLAASELTTVQPGVKLYSEYCPNLSSKFKGTIVFINGSGDSIQEWKKNKTFFQCAKKMGSLFLYDRSGLGKSPPNFNFSPKNPITVKLMSQQLLILLNKNHIKPPYLIVSHSWGGMYAGYFALKNSKLTKGLLMIDPAPKYFNYSENIMKPLKARIADAKKYPATIIYKKYGGSKPNPESFYIILGFSQSKNELKKLGGINNHIPVVIISSTYMEHIGKPIREDWFVTQKQWLNQNPNSKILQVKSGHYIQQDQPKIVCGEIKALVNIE